MYRSILLLTLAACTPAPTGAGSSGPAMATFDGPIAVTATFKAEDGTETVYTVPQGLVDAVAESAGEQRMRQMRETGQFSKMLEQMGTNEVLFQRALDANAHTSDAAQKQLALAYQQVVVRTFLESLGEAAITDEALQKAYDDRAVQYKVPQVKARHILVQTEEEANAARERLNGGESFEKLAEELSIDARTKTKGGDLGWFREGQMMPEINTAAMNAAVGEVVGPVMSRSGAHLLEVMEKRDATPLDEVRDQLGQELQGKAVNEYIETLTGALTIEVAEGSSE